MLALCAHLVGQVMAMQDQRKVTSDAALDLVIANIKVGNAEAEAELIGKTARARLNSQEATMAMRSTYTFVELEVPPAFYDLVARKLIEAEYYHCFEVGALRRKDPPGQPNPDLGPIDMHGLALTRGPDQPTAECPLGPEACPLERQLRREAVDVAAAREIGVRVGQFLADHPRQVQPAQAAASPAAACEPMPDGVAGAVSRSGA